MPLGTSGRGVRKHNIRQRAALCLTAGLAVVATALGLVGTAPVGLLSFEEPSGSAGAGPRVDAAPPETTHVPAPLVVGPTRLARVAAADDLADEPIPAPALEAYQRAAAVLADARPRCGLEWPLLAAIGKVESDHGTFAGTTLTADGVPVPAIIGPPLDGRGHRPKVPDSDAGRLDGDRGWDRAVGPLQVLPTTWTVVGVDGDGDGVRSPDDIDDAALAVGVALCSGGSDLGTPAGMREALLRYNASPAYADAVMAVEQLYRAAGLPDVSDSPTFQATPVIVRHARARITHLDRHPETLVPVPAGKATALAMPVSGPAPEATGSDSAGPDPSSPAASPGTDPCAADACPSDNPATDTPTAEGPTAESPTAESPTAEGPTAEETPTAACPEPTDSPTTEPAPADPGTDPSPPADPSASEPADPCADPAPSTAPEEPASTAVVSPSTPGAP